MELIEPMLLSKSQTSMKDMVENGLQMNDYPSIMFVVQHRMYPGLAQPSSDWVYRGPFVSAPETSASTHTLKVMEHLKKKFGLAPTVLRSFFNLQKGISFLDSNRNRYESSQCLVCYAALSPVNLIFVTMHILQLTISTSQHGFKCELQ